MAIYPSGQRSVTQDCYLGRLSVLHMHLLRWFESCCRHQLLTAFSFAAPDVPRALAVRDSAVRRLPSAACTDARPHRHADARRDLLRRVPHPRIAREQAGSRARHPLLSPPLGTARRRHAAPRLGGHGNDGSWAAAPCRGREDVLELRRDSTACCDGDGSEASSEGTIAARLRREVSPRRGVALHARRGG